MATTCKLIGKTTLGSSAATMEFTSIPATYDDLVLVLSCRTDGSVFAEVVDDVTILFNNSSSNFTYRNVLGLGNSVQSSTITHNFVNGSTSTANTFGNMEIYIPNYAGSTNKSFSVSSVTENNATSARILASAGLWSQTAAITSVKIDPAYGLLVANSSAYLYGIKKS